MYDDRLVIQSNLTGAVALHTHIFINHSDDPHNSSKIFRQYAIIFLPAKCPRYSLHSSVCNKTFAIFSPWILGQIGLPMTVLESAHHEDSKTPPYILNLMKLWQSYLRLKTIDTISKIDLFNFLLTLGKLSFVFKLEYLS